MNFNQTDAATNAEIVTFKGKRRPLPIPASACVVLGALDISIRSPIDKVRYSLRTRKSGVEMMLHLERFHWNVSALENVYPANFAAARLWLQRYAARYGQTFTEADPRRPRTKRATGDAATLLKAGGCRETWLRSDVPSLWAEAMVRCQSPAAACGAKGMCEYGICDMEMDAVAEEEASA